jgi:hypothetical protein
MPIHTASAAISASGTRRPVKARDGISAIDTAANKIDAARRSGAEEMS